MQRLMYTLRDCGLNLICYSWDSSHTRLAGGLVALPLTPAHDNILNPATPTPPRCNLDSLTTVNPGPLVPKPESFSSQVDAELLALEGAPSVSAALRALRESPSTPDAPAPPAAVRAAAELLLAYVTNALRDPRNPRVHRVRAGNPAFQRALGRLGGCEGAMIAVGFEPRDRGAVFVLREGGAGAGAGGAGGGKDRQEVSAFVCASGLGWQELARRVRVGSGGEGVLYVVQV